MYHSNSYLKMVSPICIPFLSFFLFSFFFSKAKKNHRHDPVCITRSMGEKRKLYFYISRRLDFGLDFLEKKSLFPSNFLSLGQKIEQFGKTSLLFDKKWPKHRFCQIPMCQMVFFFWCINKFHQSKIEVCKNCSAFFVTLLLMSGKSEGMRGFLFQKIWACVSTRHRGEL